MGLSFRPPTVKYYLFWFWHLKYLITHCKLLALCSFQDCNALPNNLAITSQVGFGKIGNPNVMWQCQPSDFAHTFSIMHIPLSTPMS